MSKMKVGDVCAVPIDGNIYGLCQVMRQKGETSFYFVVIFDIKLNLEELRYFDPIKIHRIPILAAIPANVSNIKKIPLYWKVLVNMPLVSYDVPMFSMSGTFGKESKNAIINFSSTHYRHATAAEIKGMMGVFNYEKRKVEGLLYHRFVDSSFMKGVLEYTQWSESTIRESDMLENSHRYMQWEGFGNNLDFYSKSISELELLNEKRINDPIHEIFMEACRNAPPWNG